MLPSLKTPVATNGTVSDGLIIESAGLTLMLCKPGVQQTFRLTTRSN
jgi:hypothetical protein